MASRAKNQLNGFMDFIREQGVVGLAVGFILGGAVSNLVSSLVDYVINPLVGLALGKVALSDKVIALSDGEVLIEWGKVATTLIDFLIIAAVVYWGVKALKLDKLDKKKS